MRLHKHVVAAFCALHTNMNFRQVGEEKNLRGILCCFIMSKTCKRPTSC